MTIRTFNISDDVYIPFRQLHKGDMSNIVESMLKEYLGCSQGESELSQISLKLSEARADLLHKTASINKLQIIYEQKLKEQQDIKTSNSTLNAECEGWIKDTISFYKSQHNYSELELLAAHSGHKTVKGLLRAQWQDKRELKNVDE